MTTGGQTMTRRIFISHQREDKEPLKRFMLLRETMKFDFAFFDRSLADPAKKDDPEYIRRFIRDKLHITDVTVVLIGDDTHRSTWVQYEIEESVRRGNPLLGIRLEGKSDARVPSALTEQDARVIDWETNEFGVTIEEVIRESGQKRGRNIIPPSMH